MGVPVTNTLLGKGIFPETHELSVGMLGMHGTAYANKAVVDCDLIMSVGSRWDDRIVGKLSEFCTDAVKLHIDIDPAEMGKMVIPDVSVVGDANAVMERLLEECSPGEIPEIGLNRSKCGKRRFHFPTKPKVRFALRPSSMSFTSKPKARPSLRRMLDNTRCGRHSFINQIIPTPGCLPAGEPWDMVFRRPLVPNWRGRTQWSQLICGDGGFQMTLPELSTAAIQKLPIKILVIDNKYLGMVRQWQHLFYDNRLSGVELTGNPDFVKVAEGYG